MTLIRPKLASFSLLSVTRTSVTYYYLLDFMHNNYNCFLYSYQMWLLFKISVCLRPVVLRRVTAFIS
jgi:hypothetical protein